jgi:CHAT domain-containing protein
MFREPSSKVVQFAAHMKAQVTHQVILAGIPRMNSEPGRMVYYSRRPHGYRCAVAASSHRGNWAPLSVTKKCQFAVVSVSGRDLTIAGMSLPKMALSGCFILLALLLCGSPCRAQTGTFIAPPRTIADITAILDQEKPDRARIAALQAEAGAAAPTNADPQALIKFHYGRAQAEANLGRFPEAISDLKKAIQYARDQNSDLIPLLRYLGIQLFWAGQPEKALQAFSEAARILEQDGRNRILWRLHTYRWMISINVIFLGHLQEAEALLGKTHALLTEARKSPEYGENRSSWEGQVEEAEAQLLLGRGQYRQAEAAFHSAQVWESQVMAAKSDAPSGAETRLHIYHLLAREGLMKARQGRLAEAESDERRALLGLLGSVGKYNQYTAALIPFVADILVEQGRYIEAEQLVRADLGIYESLGFPNESHMLVYAQVTLAEILIAQKRWKDAAEIYGVIDEATKPWDAETRDYFPGGRGSTPGRIYTLYNTGQISAGLEAARALVAKAASTFGGQHLKTALARGYLAVGLARLGRDAEARDEFRAAMPILTSSLRDVTDVEGSSTRWREEFIGSIVESYIALLTRFGEGSGTGAAIEGFTLAEAIRGRSVQTALFQSSAREATRDAELAELARQEQDLAKEIGAQRGLLNNLLTLPSDQRDDNAIDKLRLRIDELSNARSVAQSTIRLRFPSYADLIDPKPPSVDEIKATLRPGEALLSFYFGENESFVWAVPKDGAVAFASVPLKAVDLAAKVHRLRQALEPDFTLIREIPAFDLTLAYELYELLLNPVEAAWGPSKSLIVVTNGALGELPLGLLPTAPAQVNVHAKPLFAGYRDVKWLARSHAITVLPSASALVTLRHLPPGSATREKLIGFGDPYFNEQQAAEAEASPEPVEVAADQPGPDAVTRGLRLKRRASPHTEDVDTAELAMLPRLPDTRLELTTIAKVLKVDPAKALYLGKAANEQNVETMDLSRFRIIDFATHGLVPGDIDGLTQPALALTAPQVAGVKGNGLLTMEKILALKLDADWVVLSACNTAAGAGQGAEAVSGLGRAFFYAGTRALLVTNWPVESASARELTSDLFRRVAADPNLTRAEALRQAMMAVLDGPGSVDSDDDTVFTYAHPLFWAPYSLIGDGGGS